MRVDAPECQALAAHLVDEQSEHEEDGGAGETVPDVRGHGDAGAGDDVGPDPRDRGEQRDEYRRTSAEPPARETDGDEVEDREAVVGTGRDVDEPDDPDPYRGEKREREHEAPPPYVEVREPASWDGPRPQRRVPFAHDAPVCRESGRFWSNSGVG